MNDKEKFDDYYSEIGMCNCGSPIKVKNLIYDLIVHSKSLSDGTNYEVYSSRRKEIIRNVDPDVIFEIIFHVLGSAGLMEHGGSVYGSWLTDEGEEFLTLLEKFKDSDEFVNVQPKMLNKEETQNLIDWLVKNCR